MYQDGTSDWELIKKHFPKAPMDPPKLPDTVLQAQGMK
jgi:hypothetical protein